MAPHGDSKHALRRLLIAIAVCLACPALAPASESDGLVQFQLAYELERLAVAPLPHEQSPEAVRSSDSSPLAEGAIQPAAYRPHQEWQTAYSGFGSLAVGYDAGFVMASREQSSLNTDEQPFLLRLNGWGQLRHTLFDSSGANPDLNQFQLKRGRLVFSGHAFTPDFSYFVQLDGRSSSGDDIRLLDYYLTYDFGHHALGLRRDTLEFKTGRYKMPFTLARYLSGREFEFSDRSIASTFFDVNRSLGWGLGGRRTDSGLPYSWEVAVFNGLVTGGAETGSSGSLDNNFAYSGRLFFFPLGEWEKERLADLKGSESLALRTGIAFANSTVEREGLTEFQNIRVVDTGARLESLLAGSVNQYTVSLYAVDVSAKWRGWSSTFEYYFRSIDDFDDPSVSQLFDHGFWLQVGKFVIPGKVQLVTRWSRVVGESGSLGAMDLSSDEVAGGIVWYAKGQHAKLTLDATHINGSPVNSSALDLSPGDDGWLFRSQVQFAF